MPTVRFAPPQRLPREVWVLSGVAFLIALGFGVLYPVLPVFARTFGVSNFLVATVLSAFALMRLVTSPLVGRFGNRFDERTMLVVGIWIVAVSSALAGFSRNFVDLLVLRGLGGIGSAIFSISSMALLLAVAPPERRGQASGLYSGGFMLGAMTGPAVGGLLTAISLTAPFFFYAATLAGAALVGQFLLPKGITVRSDATPKTETVPFLRAINDARFRAATWANFANGWQANARSLLVPLIIVEVLGMAPSWTGIALGIAAAVQTLALWVAGRATDTRGRRPMLAVGSVVTAVMGIGFAYAGALVPLVILLCIYGAGASFTSTASTAAVGDAIGGRRGTAIAGYQMASDVGAILGPLAAGAFADMASLPAAFAAGAGLLLIAALLALRMPREFPGAQIA